MHSKFIDFTAIAFLATVASAPAVAAHLKGAQFASQARFPLAKAQKTALAARPGAIVDQELEREAGGSELRYSCDIRAAGKTYEVGIDANTGQVPDNAAEGANPDSCEL